MLRTQVLSVSVALGTLFAGSAASAAEISASDSTTNHTNVFTFDFTGSPSWPTIDEFSELLGVSAEWTFTPGEAAEGFVNLNADLRVAGQDTGVGFDVTFDQSQMGAQALSVNSTTTGLTFGADMVDALLEAPDGVVEGVLNFDGSDVPGLESFFTNGGQLDVTLNFTTRENEPGGGGGQVPEPASLLIWGAVGAGAMAHRKYRKAKSA
jgi:hypothetical protein